MVRLTSVVSESTLRPPISSEKSPKAELGIRPAIKLFVAGVHVGVSGSAPVSFVVEMERVARAESGTIKNAAKTRHAITFRGALQR
jgi:hypothetical protein